MTHTTLRRRLLAGVAGLAIGISGALALSLPAQAGNQHDKGHQQDGPRVTTKHVTECDGLKIKLFANAPGSGNSFRVLDANGNVVWPEGVDAADYGPNNLDKGWVDHGKWVMVPLGPETAFPVEVSYWSLSNPGGPNWRNAPFGSTNWPVIVDWKPAPGAWPKCGDSPSVEIVEDCEGNVTVTVNAGNTRRTWRVDGKDEKFLDVGETGVWTADSIDALVEWFHENSKEWKQADESYVTRTPAEDCPEETTPPEDEPEETTPPEDEGEGGELPKTGAPTGLIAAGAALMLTAGAGMYLVARRRRITFTA